jgi:hypothetical protein
MDRQKITGIAGFQRSLKGLKAIACAVALYAAGSAQAQTAFDWSSDPITGPTPPVAGYIPAPFLKGATPGPSNSAAVGTYLAGQPIKALKIDNNQVLSPTDFSNVYGTNNVNYTFIDKEGVNAAADALAIRNSIAASAGTGPALIANQSFVGNFRMFPGTGDTSGVGSGPSLAAYLSSGMNMANEDLYPGSPSYKNPSQFGGTSASPNIRSTLFTLPINRLTYVTSQLPTGNKNIPYVDRFNNWGNASLQNGTAQGQPAFIPGATPNTANQMLSRGDFSAMIAHYRLRGADGYHLLDGGVVGYTQAQFEQDAQTGWNLPAISAVFSGGGAHLASLDTVTRVDGVVTPNESSGVVASGVYSLTQAGGLGKLALLVSNMDEISHNVDFQQKIGGKTVPGVFSIGAGQHKLLDFTGAGTQWALQNVGGTAVFVDTNRNDIGVPEPTMVGGLALLGCFGIARRRKATV